MGLLTPIVKAVVADSGVCDGDAAVVEVPPVDGPQVTAATSLVLLYPVQREV